MVVFFDVASAKNGVPTVEPAPGVAGIELWQASREGAGKLFIIGGRWRQGVVFFGVRHCVRERRVFERMYVTGSPVKRPTRTQNNLTKSNCAGMFIPWKHVAE